MAYHGHNAKEVLSYLERIASDTNPSHGIILNLCLPHVNPDADRLLFKLTLKRNGLPWLLCLLDFPRLFYQSLLVQVCDLAQLRL
jgi:hypothetical protein